MTRASQSVESMTSTHSMPVSGAPSHHRTSGHRHRKPSHGGAGGGQQLHCSESDLLSDSHAQHFSTPRATAAAHLSPNRTPTNTAPPQVSRSAENLLDGSICDVVNDTPVPTTSRVTRRATVKGIEIRDQPAGGSSSAEASPSHSLPGTPARKPADAEVANEEVTPAGEGAVDDEVDAVENGANSQLPKSRYTARFHLLAKTVFS